MAKGLFFITGLLLLMIFCMVWLWQGLRRFGIWRWKRRLDLNRHHQIHQKLFKQVDGFKLSLQARQGKDAIEYVYGEIKFIPFIALLSLVKLDSNTVFYDLGSGSGRAVLACAMVFKIKKCCGIEMFEALHQVSCQQKERLYQLSSYHEKARAIQFYHHDFLSHDLSDATLIFASSTAFLGESWERLNQQFEKLEKCHTIITISKPLSCPAYSLIRSVSVEMSWGVVIAYIHQRKAADM